MTSQIPLLPILAPFFFSFAVSIIGWYRPKMAWPLTVFAMALSVMFSVMLVHQIWIDPDHVITYRLGNWPPPIGIQFVVDPLNAGVLMLIATVGFLNAIWSYRSVPKTKTHEKAVSFYTLYLLLIVGCQGMSITGDAFNLYVFLEISSLTSYALIAMGKGRAALSCFHYIIMGTIGASFYLLGVGYLYIKTGSLNMADISVILAASTELQDSKSIHIGFALIFLGMWIKMAFFPLHNWLPNAYSYAPAATSNVVAPLMTKVSIYVMIRYMYTVFQPDYTFDHFLRAELAVILSIAAIVIGSFYALARVKIRKMLAFLIVSEVGYMVGGAWLNHPTALNGAIFHIIADGLMTLCLFMFAGAIIYKNRTGNILAIHGLFTKMPYTCAAFIVGAFSMIGIPPTAGFFSKWYLISGAFQAGNYYFIAALLISSLINAIIFFRIIERAFFEKSRKPGEEAHQVQTRDEAPLSMLIPMITTALLIILLGVFSSQVIDFINHFTQSVMG